MVNFFFEDTNDFKLDRELLISWLSDMCENEGVILDELSLVFCSDKYLLGINKKYINHDYYTDIITFDYCDGASVSGELYISVDRVKDNAKTHNELFNNELNRVMVHGILHLLGYMDKSKADQTEMTHLENTWLKSFNTLSA